MGQMQSARKHGKAWVPLVHNGRATQPARHLVRHRVFAHALRQAQNGRFQRSAHMPDNTSGDTVSEFRKVFLIYCLQQLPDGSYVALNRRYKPVGVSSPEWVEYENLPVRFRFHRALSARQVAALSCNADATPERIYLYSDSCLPTASQAHWQAYSARLQRLAGYKVKH